MKKFTGLHDLNHVLFPGHRYYVVMDIFTLIAGGAIVLFLTWFMLRLSYAIVMNLINGRKFHHALEQEFHRLRLSNMLGALGIDKTAYLYQTRVKDIKQQMSNCADCKNTGECDEKLASQDLNVGAIDFCNNEAELKEIKQQIQKH